MQTRMYQLGMPTRVSICGPQRVVGWWSQVGIVQLTQFQRVGAGSMTTGDMVKAVLAGAGVTIDWTYDDTLIGQGQGGTDAVVFTIPEIALPADSEKINTGAANRIEPNLDACVLQYMDMAAPREIPTPVAGGATDVLFEQKYTSGWAPRPEAVTVLSLAY
jgi:hypothetical protein